MFRIFALLCSVVPFVLLEIGLSIAGLGQRDPTDDPFVGFAEVVPLFEPNADGTQYVISEKRKKFFAHDEFPAKKSPKTFRIFVLGGSTVQGRPYSIETSFTTFLQLALEEADSKTNWEVINCGGISYASYRLVPILKECLKYEPDLFIICTGHNEFLEDRSYGEIKSRPDWIETPTTWMMNSRTVTVATNLFSPDTDETKSVLPSDADAMLDYRNGIDAFQRDLEWNAAVAGHFESNLRRMVQITNQADVPTLLMLPPSNLSGTAPFKSEPGEGLSVEQLTEIEMLKKKARDLYRTDLRTAIEIWNEVVDLDPDSASNWYELGQCLEIKGRFKEARTAFVEARDRDICSLRMTSPLESIMQTVAETTQTPLLNLHQLLESKTTSGILGDIWLVDHVHPEFEGHYEIALEIARWMKVFKKFELNEGWESRSRKRFATHFESLDSTYFHQGQRMLESLRGWTQGDREGPPVEKRFPHRFDR